MTIRKAEKAGSWYAGNGHDLSEEATACLSRAETQYGRPQAEAGTLPVAIVSPHAGLAFSGSVAAVAFRMVRDALPKVDAFVVFGACHRFRLSRPALWASGCWQTPLGDIQVDSELARAMILKGIGENNESAHAGDNAIELQTPFIRFLFPEAKIVPIAMSSFPDSWRVGYAASMLASASGKTVACVASTDLTHYGAAFGIMPAGVGQPALDWLAQNDDRFLSTLTDMDLDNIVPVAERDHSACGAGAAAAAAGWANARGCTRGVVLARTNSHEVMPNGIAEHMVGYASLAYAS
jgi:Predicted dioxygenase